MMNSKYENPSLVAMLLGIFALSFAIHAEAQPNAAPNLFCNVPEMEGMEKLCLKMVGGAKTWEQAATYSVNRILRRVDRASKPLLATIDSKLMPSMPISMKAQINDICKNAYEDAADNLRKCQNYIKSDPALSLASTLTSVYTSFEDCRDAIVEENGQPDIQEVTQFKKRIQRLITVALIIAKQEPQLLKYNTSLAKGEFQSSQGDPSLIGPISPNSFGANNP